MSKVINEELETYEPYDEEEEYHGGNGEYKEVFGEEGTCPEPATKMRFMEGLLHVDSRGISFIKEGRSITNDVQIKVLYEKMYALLKSKYLPFKGFIDYSLFGINELGFITILKTLGGEIFQYILSGSAYTVVVRDSSVFEIEHHIHENENWIYVQVHVYCKEIEDKAKIDSELEKLFSKYIRKDEVTCEIQWDLLDPEGRLTYKRVTETLDDVIYKEAYPYLDIDSMIDAYLAGDEPVLIFTGPPGTGKTRLIRYIIKKMAIKEENQRTSVGLNLESGCEVLYTCSPQIIENGTIFVNFLLGNFRILVLEDIDNHLKPRKEGNDTMYSLLSSSSGIVVNSAKPKKIILSTNLPNAEKVDEALIRPGRCFSIVSTRKLNSKETIAFLKAAGYKEPYPQELLEGSEFALSELYHLMKHGTISTKYEQRKKVGFGL